MNKTTVVFYGSMLVLVWSKVQDMVKPLVSSSLFNWLGIIAVIGGVVTFQYYEQMTGATTPPQQP